MQRKAKSRPPITVAERALAHQMMSDFRRYENMGAREAATVAARVQGRVLRAFKAGGDVYAVIRREFEEVHAVLVSSMTASHLAGIARASRTVPRAKLAKRIYFQSKAFLEAVKFLRQRVNLTPSQVRAIEAKYESQAVKVLSGVTRAVEQRVQRAITKAVEQGLTTRDGTALVADAFVKAGVTPRHASAIEAVFRTQAQIAYSAGRFRADQDPAVQQILWGYKYVSVGDDRVREAHALLDGMTLEKDDPRWDTLWPPNGWNCRCQVIPVFEERQVFMPSARVIEGRLVEPLPDAGFSFNPGKVLPS